ncbi:MAG: hypothetical protein ACYC9M_08545 [Desulfobulbaceae bacterium]
MKFLHATVLAILITLALDNLAMARSLAVLPLLDLTQDENGVNFSLTEYLSKKAEDEGFTVLPESDIMAFMVRHRIRSLGILTTYEVNTLRQELQADYVLLGTVCQLGQKPAAKVSLSLQMVRTADEAVVWSLIKDLHEEDLISLLAISDPQSLNDLYERYFSTLFDSMPAEIKQGPEPSPSVGILTLNLHPEYVKPGERVEAEVRVYYDKQGSQAPEFHLLIDNKEYPVDREGDVRLLKASWLAQDKDGKYGVDLVSVFPSGQRHVQSLGEYTVDSVAPELTVDFLGTTVDGNLYFNKNLSILPRLKIPEAIDRWDVSVFDKDQELLVLYDGTGQIPPRIYWNGMITESEKALDGRYLVQVHVWDRAENQASSEGFVNLMSTDPRLKLTVDRKEGDVHVQLDNEVQSPVAFWFAKVYEKNGGMLTSKVGETLPATLDFKLKTPDSNEPLELIFAAQDRYGNRTWQKVEDLLNREVKKVEKEVVPESQWLENF